MKIYGTFANRNDEKITVTFFNTTLDDNDINIDESDDIRFDADPVNIRTIVDDVFTHVIKTSCEINLVTKRWLGDFFFVKNPRSCVVNIHKGNELIFAGYVTARSYNQPYANKWDVVTINCIDKLQMLEDEKMTDSRTYKELRQSALSYTFSYMLDMIGFKNTDLDLNVYPSYMGTASWRQTGFIEKDGQYYGVETAVNVLDANTAVSTGSTRTSQYAIMTNWVTTEETASDKDGILHYVEYETVNVNGVQTRTGKTRLGDASGQPVEDTSYERWFVPLTVKKVAAGDYYEYGQWMAYLTNGATVVMTDGLGEHLQCDYRYAPPGVIDTNGHRLMYAHVEFQGQDYYFNDDVIQGMKVGKYNIEGRCNTTEEFWVIYEMFPSTIEQTPDVNGTYLFYIDDDVYYEPRDMMFLDCPYITDIEYINTIDGVSWRYEGYDMYTGCTYLKTGFVPDYLGGCNNMFSNCLSLENVVCAGSVPTSYNNFFQNAARATIYAPESYVGDWEAAFPNNTVIPLSYYYTVIGE